MYVILKQEATVHSLTKTHHQILSVQGDTMSGSGSYFKKALSDMAFDTAYGDSIRHLYDSGYSPEEIQAYLDTPSLSIEKIVNVIQKHEAARDTDNSCRYEYVKEYDSFGHSSFVRRRIRDDDH